MERSKIETIIVECINSLNLSLVESEKCSNKTENTLFGEGSALDSMGLLNLLMDLEEKLERTGVIITILDDHALSQKNSPFRTISTLADYICRKIENGK